jgi:quercetin dioxygenase-like cupin family protein
MRGTGLAMNAIHIVVAATLSVANGAAHVAHAQQPDAKRIDLQRYDLSVPGRDVVQVRVELAPGVPFPKHTHLGEEVIYVLEGSLEYQVEGKAAVTRKAGESSSFRPERSTARATSAAAWGRN